MLTPVGSGGGPELALPVPHFCTESFILQGFKVVWLPPPEVTQTSFNCRRLHFLLNCAGPYADLPEYRERSDMSYMKHLVFVRRKMPVQKELLAEGSFGSFPLVL